MRLPPICVYCKWMNPTTGREPWTCKAFPQGIPDGILDNEIDHRKPYKGDHGKQFEAHDPGGEDTAAAIFDDHKPVTNDTHRERAAAKKRTQDAEAARKRAGVRKG